MLLATAMPSFRHEALVMLIRENPTMLVELLRSAFGVEPPPGARVSFGNEVLRSLVPVEIRADTVLLLEGLTDSMAMIVESQLEFDPGKRRVWPAYVALLHRKLGVPVLLVVVAIYQEVAEKCARPIEVGPGFVLRPLVIGPSLIPPITDPDLAAQNVELAVLSTMAHANAEPGELAHIAAAAVAAIDRAPSFDLERKRDYADIVFDALGPVARALVEALTMNPGDHRYHSEFARHYFDAGEARGRAIGEVDALLKVLAARRIVVEGEALTRIQTCTDLEVLGRWLARAAVASSLAEVLDD